MHQPKRKSLTKVGEKRCVSDAEEARVNRNVIGKSGQWRRYCSPAAEKLETTSASGQHRFRTEKKNRAEIFPGWREIRVPIRRTGRRIFPGFPTISVPVPPAVPEIDGTESRLIAELLPLKFSKARVTIKPRDAREARPEKAEISEALSDLLNHGKPGLLICVPEKGRCVGAPGSSEK